MDTRKRSNERPLTPKQQKFCEIFVETGNATKAYRQAYNATTMSSGALRVNAFRLKDNPRIASRCEELLKQKAAITLSLADRLEISIERTLRELARIAFANVADYLSIDADGSVSIDPAKISSNNAAGMKELVAEEYTVGSGSNQRLVRRTKIKMFDKRAALVALLHYLVDAEDSAEKEQGSEDLRPRDPSPDHIAEVIELFSKRPK